ncbi:unnamed protein product, partial [Laminaria digitata]
TAALVDARERTTVDVDATGYDERTSYPGCSPNGCIPKNTRDRSRSSNSRWSCKGDILDSSDDDEGCCITYYFEEPQDIVEVKLAFYKGKEDTRTLKVYDNGSYHSKIKSSGSTNGYQTFELDTDETEELKFCLNDDDDVWISITEVR